MTEEWGSEAEQRYEAAHPRDAVSLWLLKVNNYFK